MVARFNHFVITRFNVSLHWPENARVKSAWLRYRFDLFEKFCFPSFQNQTENNFTWLILFDSETPGDIRQRISYLEEQLPRFKPLFVHRHSPGTTRHYLVSTRYSELIQHFTVLTENI